MLESIELTQELVKIKSTSLEEKAIMLYAKEYFEKHNVPVSLDEFIVKQDEKAEKTYNVEVGNIEEAEVLIAAHLDTVEFDKEKWKESKPLSGDIKDKKLYGRGSADTKSNAAAAMVALKNAYQKYENPNVALILEADEEGKFSGAKRFLSKYEDKSLNVKFAVMCEPEDLKIINEHKGLFHSKAVIEREMDETHASKAQKVDESDSVYQPSEHAIEEAIPVLNELKKFKDELMNRKSGKLGPVTFTITVAQGGKSNNIIPQKFIIETDSRVPPRYSSEELARELKERVSPLTREGEFKTYAVHEAVRTQENNQWMKLFQESVEEAGVEPETDTTDAFTELGLYQEALGTSGVIFGTSPNKVIHNPDEYVDIESIPIVQETFENMIEKIN
ncbi:MAG: hypothetical protein BRC29_03610 [Nanohaloarchaea archaeon SW_7_43_1]|nr:MAG: hypothetical protein BRC29_03610 [Nanohaloarchaea archaeon SW_7_43_1]